MHLALLLHLKGIGLGRHSPPHAATGWPTFWPPQAQIPQNSCNLPIYIYCKMHLALLHHLKGIGLGRHSPPQAATGWPTFWPPQAQIPQNSVEIIVVIHPYLLILQSPIRHYCNTLQSPILQIAINLYCRIERKQLKIRPTQA